MRGCVPYYRSQVQGSGAELEAPEIGPGSSRSNPDVDRVRPLERWHHILGLLVSRLPEGQIDAGKAGRRGRGPDRQARLFELGAAHLKRGA
jgi:hypothetical protein